MCQEDAANGKTKSTTLVGTLHLKGKCDLCAYTRAGSRVRCMWHPSIPLNVRILDVYWVSSSVSHEELWNLFVVPYQSLVIQGQRFLPNFWKCLVSTFPFLPPCLPPPMHVVPRVRMQHNFRGRGLYVGKLTEVPPCCDSFGLSGPSRPSMGLYCPLPLAIG